jgi:triphosphatase
MNSEIELKLFAPDNCLDALIEQFKDANVLQHETRTLQSVYFDTPSRQLRELGMGLRVRTGDGENVQTLKTAGRVIGGLHERPEYNLGVTGTRPHLSRFEQVKWPAQIDITQLQTQLQPVFITDFERQTWLLDLDNDTLIEVAYDRGELRAEPQCEVISEIELELVKGDVAQLFTLARRLCQIGHLQLGNDSKASRGYALADGLSLPPVNPLEYVPLQKNTAMTQAFSTCFEYALHHWQHHEQLFCKRSELASLVEVRQGVMLTHQILSLFEPVMQYQCPWREELLWLARQLSWLDEAVSIERLLDQQGQFIKKLPKRRTLLRLLEERREALPSNAKALELFYSVRYATLMIDIVAWLRQGDWHINALAEVSLDTFAGIALDNSWRELRESPFAEKTLKAQQYLSLAGLLQRNLMTGVSVGVLFDGGTRDEFRFPWKDVLKGIEDLRLLQPISELLDIFDDEDDIHAVNRWLKRKRKSLAEAMDCSRLQALSLKPYWR